VLIEVTCQLDEETERKLFENPRLLARFRAAVQRACDQLEANVKKRAPKATGDFLNSIDCTVHEFGQPYRIVGRVYSVHPAADAIEFGAGPHVVPTRAILRWMQAVNMPIGKGLTVQEVAERIQKRIAERGLQPHFTFTDAYQDAVGIFKSELDPILDSIDGHAEYSAELSSSGSWQLPWE
jgi:hypothetical protein